MKRRSFIARCIFALCAAATVAHQDVAEAANILNHVESVRVRAAVVYVGRVSSIEMLGRSAFEISAKAIVRDLIVARGDAPASGKASLRYSTYDHKTPPNDDGLQHQIKSHATVLVFADSIEEGSPSALWNGTPAEICKVIEFLADRLDKMSDEDLAFNGITREDRQTQRALYHSLLTKLQSAHE